MGRRQRKNLKTRQSHKVLGKIEYYGEVNIPTSIELIQYNASEYSRKQLSLQDDLKKNLKEGQINWFNITGISNVDYISMISKSFGLHTYDIRELVASTNIVKFVLYDNVTFALTSAYQLGENDEINTIKIAFILGDNFIISIAESPVPFFTEVKNAISNNDKILRLKSVDFLFYILLHEVNSFNNSYIIQSENNLWDIEDHLIIQEETADILHTLRSYRKNLIMFKRFMYSLDEEYENLLNNANGKVKPENMIYFENLDDKYRTTSNNIENLEDSVKSLIELYYNNNAMRMNEIMKRLTLVATIFIPLTFLVGVWGMNFANMPELGWKYGYHMAWFIFVAIVFAGIFLMRKNKWF